MRCFGGYVKEALRTTSRADGVDLAMEERLRRCEEIHLVSPAGRYVFEPSRFRRTPESVSSSASHSPCDGDPSVGGDLCRLALRCAPSGELIRDRSSLCGPVCRVPLRRAGYAAIVMSGPDRPSEDRKQSSSKRNHDQSPPAMAANEGQAAKHSRHPRRQHAPSEKSVSSSTGLVPLPRTDRQF